MNLILKDAFEYSGKPTFQGLIKAEKKGEGFYKKYSEFIEALEPKNIYNIISNTTRNIATSYFRLKGLLSNTHHSQHINFTQVFFQENSKEDLDFHLSDVNKNGEDGQYKINPNSSALHPHNIHLHHFEGVEFNETIQQFMKEEGNPLIKLSNFLETYFSTKIANSTDHHYFDHFKHKTCVSALKKKLLQSYFYEHIFGFINNIKYKHGKILKKINDYLELELELMHTKKDKKSGNSSGGDEIIRMFEIADHFITSHLSNVIVDEEEKKAYEDFKNYYTLFMRSFNFNSDIVELFSSRVFEQIYKHLRSYFYLNQNKSEGISIDEKTEKINKKLILVSSHDFYLTSNLWFLGVNANQFNYEYNDEINLLLHYENNELFLELKYNDKEIVPDFCEKDPNRINVCKFDKYMEFIQKRIHKEELLEDFCNLKIDKFPEYIDRVSHLKDDL